MLGGMNIGADEGERWRWRFFFWRRRKVREECRGATKYSCIFPEVIFKQLFSPSTFRTPLLLRFLDFSHSLTGTWRHEKRTTLCPPFPALFISIFFSFFLSHSSTSLLSSSPSSSSSRLFKRCRLSKSRLRRRRRRRHRREGQGFAKQLRVRLILHTSASKNSEFLPNAQDCYF